VAAAERVRSAFLQAAIEIDGHPVRGSLSAGITVTTDSTASLDSLLSIADEALYVAKAKGRNRVEVASKHNWQPASEGKEVSPSVTPDVAGIRLRAGHAEKVRSPARGQVAAAVTALDPA
jgi:diguanylate cyclase with GGDEF domain